MGAAAARDSYTAAAVYQVCVLYMGNIPYSDLLSIKNPFPSPLFLTLNKNIGVLV